MKTILKLTALTVFLLILVFIFVACNRDVPVRGIYLNENSVMRVMFDTLTLRATIVPANATNQRVIWKSGDNEIASVVNGRVNPLSAGITTITVVTQDGNRTATCTLYVNMQNGCNVTSPTFDIGVQSFASEQTWFVGEGVNRQEWSDAVLMSGCDKTDYYGGGHRNINADCRNSVGNDNFSGHYFSGCFVARFANVLCPGDWRVPAENDFRQLYFNLGYPRPQFVAIPPIGIIENTYIGTAYSPNGGAWGGSRFTGQAHNPTESTSRYWHSGAGLHLVIGLGATHMVGVEIAVHVNSDAVARHRGLAVRCVR